MNVPTEFDFCYRLPTCNDFRVVALLLSFDDVAATSPIDRESHVAVYMRSEHMISAILGRQWRENHYDVWQKKNR